ncbi:MAG TPA: thioredoxin domain-containing protein [Patescibacteria group bacterium]|nr:thioredoxin domain-containing protein [Patescibacteria group bacterium]
MTSLTPPGGPPPEPGPMPSDVATPETPPPHPAPSAAAVSDVRASGPRRLAGLGYVGALVLGVVIGGAGFAFASERGPDGAAAPAGNTFGRPDAPVTIEVWSDYQCSFCRLEDLLYGGAIAREYVTPGIARVVHRDFAFLGQESTDAAVAARCAGAQDPAAQLRFHDAIYTFQQGQNEGRFARENLVQLAEIVGVPSAADFAACLDDPAVAQAVADETTAGRNLGIDSTPTLRLHGPGGERVVRGFSQTWPSLRDAIEAVRGAGSSPAPAASPAPSPAP